PLYPSVHSPRYWRVRRPLSDGSLGNVSVLGSHLNDAPSWQAILPKWPIEAERWPAFTGALGSWRDLTQSRKSRMWLFSRRNRKSLSLKRSFTSSSLLALNSPRST